jgi:hypothetical protein
VTGPEHYAKAQDHLDHAASIETDGYEDSMSAWHQRQAQVHATLALAAATALAGVTLELPRDSVLAIDWSAAIGVPS